MAEYIDRKAVEKITWQEPYSHDPINVLTEVREKVRNIPTADVIPLEKIKQAYVEIENLSGQSCRTSDGVVNEVLDILDRLITESEGG